MPRISDHAVLRFLERVKGIDIEAVRAEMTSPALEAAAAFGCDTVILGTGHRMKLNGDVVATVLPKRRH
jgi:uncharacterized protein with PIN domain